MGIKSVWRSVKLQEKKSCLRCKPKSTFLLQKDIQSSCGGCRFKKLWLIIMPDLTSEKYRSLPWLNKQWTLKTKHFEVGRSKNVCQKFPERSQKELRDGYNKHLSITLYMLMVTLSAFIFVVFLSNKLLFFFFLWKWWMLSHEHVKRKDNLKAKTVKAHVPPPVLYAGTT